MADDWPDDRRETAYEEAREVINEQNATMQDIDDKAMRTVRLTTVIIGVLLASFRFDATLFDNDILAGSIVLLVLSIIAAIATYDESNLFVGPKGEYIEELAGDTEFEKGWDYDLLITFAGMISKNYNIIRRNSWLLTATNVLLVLGIITAVIAIGI